MESRRILILNKTEQLELVQLFIDELAETWSLKPELIFEINLILEEYITNLINYGYHDYDGHEITIELYNEADTLKIMITDDAGPFDITGIPDNQEIDKPVNQRKIGGLGIHLIKNMADDIYYQSENGLNQLILFKRK